MKKTTLNAEGMKWLRSVPRAAGLLGVVALGLSAGGKKYEYSAHEKAAYADAAAVEFVRPA